MSSRYAIWNNKGGVGKTFLSFMLSCEYATQHPEKKVIVVDMCPQANLSEIFLGGNGDGRVQVDERIRNNKTIGGYFDLRVASPFQITGRETDFFINLSEANKNVPDNLFLVVGSPNLEILAQVINQLSALIAPNDAWRKVHSWLLDLIVAQEQKLGDTTTFIDCNPSFSSYTELAVLSATQLIIPCSGDGSSARAIDNISSLVYDINVPYELEKGFAKQTKSFEMALPQVRMVLLNRSTQYNKRASKAFGAMYDEIRNRARNFQQRAPAHFHTGFTFHDIPDAHSPSIVCSHKSMPIGKLKSGKYDIHGITTQVNAAPLENYRKAIEAVVASL